MLSGYRCRRHVHLDLQRLQIPLAEELLYTMKWLEMLRLKINATRNDHKIKKNRVSRCPVDGYITPVVVREALWCRSKYCLFSNKGLKWELYKGRRNSHVCHYLIPAWVHFVHCRSVNDLTSIHAINHPGTICSHSSFQPASFHTWVAELTRWKSATLFFCVRSKLVFWVYQGCLTLYRSL